MSSQGELTGKFVRRVQYDSRGRVTTQEKPKARYFEDEVKGEEKQPRPRLVRSRNFEKDLEIPKEILTTAAKARPRETEFCTCGTDRALQTRAKPQPRFKEEDYCQCGKEGQQTAGKPRAVTLREAKESEYCQCDTEKHPATTRDKVRAIPSLAEYHGPLLSLKSFKEPLGAPQTASAVKPREERTMLEEVKSLQEKIEEMKIIQKDIHASTKALIEKSPDPTTAESIRALLGEGKKAEPALFKVED